MKVRITKTNGGGGGEEKPAPAITNQVRSDWNKYIDYLRSKGIAGSPDLDRNGLGNQVLQQYIKDNPGTSLSLDIVKPLQSEFIKLRQWGLDRVKAGKAAFANGVNESNFMAGLSPDDAYAGSRTTSYKFPSEYLTMYDQPTNNTTTKNLGFVQQ